MWLLGDSSQCIIDRHHFMDEVGFQRSQLQKKLWIFRKILANFKNNATRMNNTTVIRAPNNCLTSQNPCHLTNSKEIIRPPGVALLLPADEAFLFVPSPFAPPCGGRASQRRRRFNRGSDGRCAFFLRGSVPSYNGGRPSGAELEWATQSVSEASGGRQGRPSNHELSYAAQKRCKEGGSDAVERDNHPHWPPCLSPYLVHLVAASSFHAERARSPNQAPRWRLGEGRGGWRNSSSRMGWRQKAANGIREGSERLSSWLCKSIFFERVKIWNCDPARLDH